TEEQKNRRTEEQKNRRTEEQKNRRTEEQKNRRTEELYISCLVAVGCWAKEVCGFVWPLSHSTKRELNIW
ncbi:hypothetical protein, partial [Kribbella italica]